MLFNKRSRKQLKILMFLFGECSNGCDFCFQRAYTGIPSLSDFLNRPAGETADPVLAIIREYGSEYRDITVSVMGGEVFEHPEAASKLADIVKIIAGINPDVRFRISTNLMYDDISGLLLVVKTPASAEVHTSFDFGRVRFKTDDRFDMFKRNLDILSSAGVKVGVETIRTVKMLESYAAEDEQFRFFKSLTERFDVCQNELIGDYGLALTADESEELWKMCITKTPACSDLVSQFVDGGRNCLDVLRATVIGGDVTYGCAYQKYGVVGRDKKADILECVDHYGCCTCEFARVCSAKCPVERKYSRCDKAGVHEWCARNGISIENLGRRRT